MSENRIEYEDNCQVVDELVTHRATIHIKHMDERAYFIVSDTTAGTTLLDGYWPERRTRIDA